MQWLCYRYYYFHLFSEEDAVQVTSEMCGKSLLQNVSIIYTGVFYKYNADIHH